MQRRDFLRNAAAVGGGFMILRGGALRGADAPGNKLNIALIGAWGRATAHYDSIGTENVVAICDVDETHLDHASKRFPEAKRHVDWRKCLDQKGIDAVVCCTPDHQHAFVANWALNRGFHVYCEKPLGNCVEEVRVVRANYLKRRGKVATQVGTQRHAIENFNRVRELVRDGAIGEVKAAYAWGNRQIRRPGYLPGEGQPPSTLNYDLWIGPSPFHPYNPGYFGAKPGANCLNWNMFWDFGTGQVGDMGSHTMDLAWNALDAELPTVALGEGEKFNPDVAPVELHTTVEVPANDWRPAIPVHWYQGGMMPKTPKEYIDLNKIGHGAMFKGSNGFLVCDFDSRLLLPFGKDADMTYYKPRAKDALIPPLGHFQKEWIDACKGNLKTSCDFDYSGKLIESMHLGLVAYRAGKKISYDPVAGRVTDCPEANEFLRKRYRDGWTLDG